MCAHTHGCVCGCIVNTCQQGRKYHTSLAMSAADGLFATPSSMHVCVYLCVCTCMYNIKFVSVPVLCTHTTLSIKRVSAYVCVLCVCSPQTAGRSRLCHTLFCGK